MLTKYSKINVFTLAAGCFMVAPTSGLHAQVGIGTLSPEAGLHVEDSTGVLFTSPAFTSGSIPAAPAEGTGTRMMWYPGKGAFRVGYVTGNKWDTDSIGFSSFAGSEAKATNDFTFAFGASSVASGNTAVAIGTSSRATGLGALAFGYNNTSSGTDAATIGQGNVASGQNSTAMGSGSVASGSWATAIGHGSHAENMHAVAIGYNNTSSGSNATVLGNGSTASGARALALGYNNTASGNNATAMGNNATASGSYAMAMGRNVAATSSHAVAFGRDTEASGESATAMGFNSTASGNYATALGGGSTASGQFATAMGNNATASGSYSFASGSNVQATGSYSVALGRNVGTNSFTGSFILSDASTTGIGSTTNNEMSMRFSGGYRLYSNASGTIGTRLTANSNSWSTLSDSTKKENYLKADGQHFLAKIKTMKLGSWNYIGQDFKMHRHYGPMAQEFYANFGNDGIGTIGNDTTIASADIDGVMLIAIQALAEENALLRQKIEQQKKLISNLDGQHRNLHTRLDNLEALLEHTNTTHTISKNP